MVFFRFVERDLLGVYPMYKHPKSVARYIFHLHRLSFGLEEVAVECIVKKGRVVAEQVLMNPKGLFLLALIDDNGNESW